jgi:hypothetical protein
MKTPQYLKQDLTKGEKIKIKTHGDVNYLKLKPGSGVLMKRSKQCKVVQVF